MSIIKHSYAVELLGESKITDNEQRAETNHKGMNWESLGSNSSMIFFCLYFIKQMLNKEKMVVNNGRG